MKSKIFLFIITVFLTLFFIGASVNRVYIPRTWWSSLETYIDDVSESRIVDFYVDEVSDQTIVKFPLEKDITVERVTFYAAGYVTGDTTALYFYQGSTKVDSLILPDSVTAYINKTTDFTLSAESSFIELKLDDAVWGGTAGGGADAHFIIQYHVKRE